eukprot:7021765-Prymnesium_polylepis.1
MLLGVAWSAPGGAPPTREGGGLPRHARRARTCLVQFVHTAVHLCRIVEGARERPMFVHRLVAYLLAGWDGGPRLRQRLAPYVAPLAPWSLSRPCILVHRSRCGTALVRS